MGTCAAVFVAGVSVKNGGFGGLLGVGVGVLAGVAVHGHPSVENADAVPHVTVRGVVIERSQGLSRRADLICG